MLVSAHTRLMLTFITTCILDTGSADAALFSSVINFLVTSDVRYLSSSLKYNHKTID